MKENTNALEKFLVSLINTIIVFIFSLPFYYMFGLSNAYKTSVVLLFLFLNSISLFFSDNRTPGMIILNIYWKENYPKESQLIYLLLYTLSFSTIIFWFFFPFDLLLFNLIFIQLPFVLVTGSTLHGFLAGKMSGYRITK